ncbi:MAG TPA: UTP--glucose-1-phosphate uridylyltransferase GalU [Candidatus Gracilibacteria bacterium]|nr:UTP--glucose-1-phosphate uridylyltransferase GalU [Candidatus Gracilibacteria bacterium]HRY91451.1 UTP--glucose-1-phosphate uridylyltransferase GalU [Candidatus Gracilibacteria bacterium]
MKKITKAVLPAAGFGTRFLPATKSQPKEMLPIVDKPVIQYLVEEAVASGIEQIIIVTGRGKRSIEDHFDHSFELEHTLVEKGKHDLLAEVQKISQLAKIAYVRQPMPLGDGHAILCAKELLDDEPFAVLFGDDIIDHQVPGLKQLMNVYEQTGTSVIAVEKIDIKDSGSYGIIKPKSSNGLIHEVESMVEKPKPEVAPSNLGVIGKYICTPEALKALEKAKPGVGGEIRLIDGFNELLPTQKIYACEMQGKRYDTGHKLGLIEATVDFALKRPDLGPKLKAYLRTLDLK